VLYHFVAENHLPAELVPGLEDWLRSYDDVPADERHLAIHDLHLIGINDHDRPFVTPQLLEASGNVWSAAELRDRIATLEAAGITEIAYQPAGDIPGELGAFATAARG
jgi:5,10-methylenetetrahydromethanopterin reductase